MPVETHLRANLLRRTLLDGDDDILQMMPYLRRDARNRLLHGPINFRLAQLQRLHKRSTIQQD